MRWAPRGTCGWRGDGVARRRAGLTLVEVLITVSLSAILIALVVTIAGQVQSAVGLSTARLNTVEQIRALEDLLAQDLARIVPMPEGAPAPFPSAPIPFYKPAVIPPISIERNIVGAQAGDPTGITNWPCDPGRCADAIQLFATQSDNNPSSNPGMSAVGRALVRYQLDPQTTGTTTGGTPFLRSPVSGGPKVGRLRRHMWVVSSLSPAGRKVPEDVGGNVVQPSILLDNIVSFQLEYLDGQALDDYIPATGRSVDIFRDPDASTKDGNHFVLDGTVSLDCKTLGPRALAVDASTSNFLKLLPIGSPVFIRLRPATIPVPPQMFLVRGRGLDPSGNNAIYLSDRPIQEDGNPGDPLKIKAFVPPAAVRMTVVVLFGKGPENETARFVRVLPVPR